MNDEEFSREDIQMELNKIPEMEKRMDRFENEVIMLNKRITKLQGRVEGVLK